MTGLSYDLPGDRWVPAERGVAPGDRPQEGRPRVGYPDPLEDMKSCGHVISASCGACDRCEPCGLCGCGEG